MSRVGYQILGFAVWRGARWYLHRRYGDAPRRIALGALLALVLGALIFGGRRLSADSYY